MFSCTQALGRTTVEGVDVEKYGLPYDHDWEKIDDGFKIRVKGWTGHALYLGVPVGWIAPWEPLGSWMARVSHPHYTEAEKLCKTADEAKKWCTEELSKIVLPKGTSPTAEDFN